MPILKEEQALWNNQVAINDDSYGKAVIDVARRAMEILDEEADMPIDAHKVITRANEDTKAGGITGFMAGAVASIIAKVHSRGKEFNKAWNKSYGVEEDTDGTVNPAIQRWLRNELDIS